MNGEKISIIADIKAYDPKSAKFDVPQTEVSEVVIDLSKVEVNDFKVEQLYSEIFTGKLTENEQLDSVIPTVHEVHIPIPSRTPDWTKLPYENPHVPITPNGKYLSEHYGTYLKKTHPHPNPIDALYFI